MELNPYATFLGAEDPLHVLRETPGRLGGLLSTMSSEQVDRAPAPGKWSAREIMAHLADCELVFGFRLRQTLAMHGHVVQPFDQAVWGERYAAYDLPSATAMFSAAREWNLQLIKATGQEERARALTHPERGTMTFWTIVETMGGHDINHLQQVERIAAAAK